MRWGNLKVQSKIHANSQPFSSHSCLNHIFEPLLVVLKRSIIIFRWARRFQFWSTQLSDDRSVLIIAVDWAFSSDSQQILQRSVFIHVRARVFSFKHSRILRFCSYHIGARVFSIPVILNPVCSVLNAFEPICVPFWTHSSPCGFCSDYIWTRVLNCFEDHLNVSK